MNKLSAKPVSRFALLVLATMGGPLFGGSVLLAFAATHPHFFSPEASTYFVFLVGLTGAALVGAALLPSFLVAGLIGFISAGSAWGFSVAFASLILATSFGMALSRRLAPGTIEAMLASKPKWQQALRDLQAKQGVSLLVAIFFARLAPQAPFALTNLMLGQLSLPLSHLALSSWLGLLPRTIVSVSAGVGLTHVSSVSDASLAVSSTQLALGILALSLATGILVLTLRRRWRKPASSRLPT